MASNQQLAGTNIGSPGQNRITCCVLSDTLTLSYPSREDPRYYIVHPVGAIPWEPSRASASCVSSHTLMRSAASYAARQTSRLVGGIGTAEARGKPHESSCSTPDLPASWGGSSRSSQLATNGDVQSGQPLSKTAPPYLRTGPSPTSPPREPSHTTYPAPWTAPIRTSTRSYHHIPVHQYLRCFYSITRPLSLWPGLPKPPTSREVDCPGPTGLRPKFRSGAMPSVVSDGRNTLTLQLFRLHTIDSLQWCQGEGWSDQRRTLERTLRFNTTAQGR